MSFVWDRKKAPRNAEELMISEYQRMVHENEILTDELQQAYQTIDTLNMSFADAEAAFKARDEARDKRLAQVLAQDEGVLDLHKEQVVYDISIWSEYTIKRFLKDEATGDTSAEAVGAELLGLVDKMLYDQMATCKYSYDGTGIKIKKLTAKTTLSIPGFHNRTEYVYIPERSATELYQPSSEPTEDKYTSATFEECKTYACAEFRNRLREAIKDIQKESDK